MEFQYLLDNKDYETLQIELQARYEKNLKFFEEAEPAVFKKVNGHVSKEVFLVVDDEGRLNLSNGSEGDDLVYRDDPYKQCSEYIDEYFKIHRYRRMTFKPQSLILDEDGDVHITTTNKAIEYLNGCRRRAQFQEEDVVDSLFINGIGIGYIVELALKAKEIDNLVIFERYRDVMAAAMHIVDFKELYEYRAEKGLNTKIFLEQEPKDIRSFLMRYVLKIGVHYYSNIYTINHFSGEFFEEHIKDVIAKGADAFEQLGFFDDEQWGLTHTLSNIADGREIVRFFRQDFKKPVFVIANGPSLDKHEQFLKENRSKAIYVACGSALGALYNMGIKPDINVELERRYVTPEIIINTTDSDYRKGILFVGSNTVHPDTFSLFEENCMFIKPNDIGEKVILDIEPTMKPHRLPYCTPNVGNSALSLMLSAGAKSVLLVGMDCGFGQDDEHHASSSFYSKDDNTKKLFDDQLLKDGEVFVKGNFREKVKTTKVLKSSIANAERCIALFKKAKVYNLSDGALIEGAEPVKAEQVVLPGGEIEFKRKELFDLFEPLQFEHSLLEDIRDSVLNSLDVLEQFLNNAEQGDDPRAVIKKTSLYLRGLEDAEPYIYQLLKGSGFTWLSLMLKSLYMHNSREVFSKVLEFYREFIERSRNKVKHDFFELDDKESNWF
ncbi:6-hydroxymethylpterin diphosphokinase MptE-like protein [Pontibacterium sp.]|uniref:motility associated factor glycosyltransferase family protein n=1 Tax=Pontibacterium sp. TaxID=2036026 RepID=UPI003510E9E0